MTKTNRDSDYNKLLINYNHMNNTYDNLLKENKILKKEIMIREKKLNHILEYAHEKLSIVEEHQIKRICGLKNHKNNVV